MTWPTADREILADTLVGLGLDLGVARMWTVRLVEAIETHNLPRPYRCVSCGTPVHGLSRWCSLGCYSEDELQLRDDALDALGDYRRELEDFHRYDRSFD